MNTLHLRYAVEVEKTHSITKAAQNLFMGQPNLSRALRELEAEIGTKLFTRTPQGVMPTEKGTEFLTYAKLILSQMDELESIYKRDSTGDVIRLRIAVPRATYASVAFAEFAGEFNSKRQVDIHFKESDAISSISAVSHGELDVAVIRFQSNCGEYFYRLIEDNQLSFEEIWSFPMGLMMSLRHPLCEQPRVYYHMLSGYTEIVHGDYQLPPIAFSQINKNAAFNAPMKRIYVYDRGSQYDLLQRVTGAYMWVSPVPEDVLKQHKLIIKDCLHANLINTDLAIFPKVRPINRYARQFISRLKTQCGQKP